MNVIQSITKGSELRKEIVPDGLSQFCVVIPWQILLVKLLNSGVLKSIDLLCSRHNIYSLVKLRPFNTQCYKTNILSRHSVTCQWSPETALFKQVLHIGISLCRGDLFTANASKSPCLQSFKVKILLCQNQFTCPYHLLRDAFKKKKTPVGFGN